MRLLDFAIRHRCDCESSLKSHSISKVVTNWFITPAKNFIEARAYKAFYETVLYIILHATARTDRIATSLFPVIDSILPLSVGEGRGIDK